jgi:hypothetical protein
MSIDSDIDYLKHINQHDQHNNQHDYDRRTDYDHHDLEQHIIDHDYNNHRATLHWLMHVAVARRIAEMDQSLWR